PGAVHHWAAQARPPEPAAPARAVPVERVPPVSIRCFGGFQMDIGGQPVELNTVRARARSALRLLAMQAGQAVHREVIIEALWPDLPPAAATRNLQVTISSVRGLLEPDSGRGKSQLLVRTGDAYAVAIPPGGYADTAVFTEAFQRWLRLRAGGTPREQAAALRAVL